MSSRVGTGRRTLLFFQLAWVIPLLVDDPHFRDINFASQQRHDMAADLQRIVKLSRKI